MAFCTGCGMKIPDNSQFCTGCGKSIDSNVSPQKEAAKVETVQAQPVVTPQQPVSASGSVYIEKQEPPHGSPYAVMGVGTYVGVTILFCIPIIGWLICIVWACGGCKNRNKRNYARAVLILTIIGVIIAVILSIVISLLLGSVTAVIGEYFKEAGVNFMGENSGFNEIIDAFKEIGMQVPVK